MKTKVADEILNIDCESIHFRLVHVDASFSSIQLKAM